MKTFTHGMPDRDPGYSRPRSRKVWGALSGLALFFGAGACGADDNPDCMAYPVYSQNVASPLGAALRTGPSVDADLADPEKMAPNRHMLASHWVDTDTKAYPENPDGSPSEGEIWYHIEGYYTYQNGEEVYIEFSEEAVFANSAALRSRRTSAADVAETDEQFVARPDACEMSEREAASLAAA